MVRRSPLKKILFVTGTRADFSKLKTLIESLLGDKSFSVRVFITGMHLSRHHGLTYKEILKLPLENYNIYSNQKSVHQDLILASTISGLHTYVRRVRPDMVVVHGDRVEALAGAIVGACQNILVSHIEGGEISGTIDESLRHAISKLAHLHFVSNDSAKNNLIQLGEHPQNIYVIGTSSLDFQNSKSLPTFLQTKKAINLPFTEYALVLYHPVTTEIEPMFKKAHALVMALISSKLNYVVISPNNDPGSSIIFREYAQLSNNSRFRFYPSVPFETYLSLLKHSLFLIGNSSSGVHEAPFFGVPTIDIGTRQDQRTPQAVGSVFHSTEEIPKILKLINRFRKKTRFPSATFFSGGDSALTFLELLRDPKIWHTSLQKQLRLINQSK